MPALVVFLGSNNSRKTGIDLDAGLSQAPRELTPVKPRGEITRKHCRDPTVGARLHIFLARTHSIWKALLNRERGRYCSLSRSEFDQAVRTVARSFNSASCCSGLTR